MSDDTETTGEQPVVKEVENDEQPKGETEESKDHLDESKNTETSNNNDASESGKTEVIEDASKEVTIIEDHTKPIENGESTIGENIVEKEKEEKQSSEATTIELSETLTSEITEAKSVQKTEVKTEDQNIVTESPIKEEETASNKENIVKTNVPNDDVIFVKPKDKERNHCYCGKDRNLNIVELLCANCNRWFHESCISYQLGKLVPFMMNYVFLCKNCSPSGLEIFKKNQSTIPQLCVTALANLVQTGVKEGKPRKYFSKDKDVIPFIESHWEGMTTTARRVTQSWHSTVLRTLTKDTNLFRTNTDSAETSFGLLNHDITQVKPNYELMLRGGHLKMTEMGVQPVGGTGLKGRGAAKRKLAGEGSNVGLGKRNRVETAPVKLSPHGYPLEHPYNKDGFRYFLAEPDPHAPFRQEFDESSELAGKPIPGWLYRPLCPNSVLLALHDRAPQLRVSEDRLSVVGEKGYCMVRATHYVSRGMWYFEVNVDEMRDGSACRIGWGQAFANLQTPLGFDKFGYCWRSRKGTKFHEAQGKHYSQGFGEGDTLGLLIYLPENKKTSHLPQTLKDRPLVKFKSHLYYEEKDYLAEKLKNLKPLGGSKIIFFRNGECQGEAFSDIYAGQYYPTLSLYKTCVLSVNFGPDFKYPPPKQQYPYKAMWERSEETICEQTLSDLAYLTDNEGKLKLDF